MQVGWNGDRRVHGSIIHIDIRDGKVWIEYNGTDAHLGEELVAVGIPQHDIVLGFQPKELRSLAGFGVGRQRFYPTPREPAMSRVEEQYRRACEYLAGGVSSSTRLNRALGHPLLIDRAEGCRVWDLD